MGGAQAGEVASQLAAAAVREGNGGGEAGQRLVVELIQEANRRVWQRANEDAAASGMGTTITVALVEPEGRVLVGHVGDSRAYLLRDDRLEQLTDDHSLVAELLRSGKLSPAEAETHPQRSVITRALGSEPDVEVDVHVYQARAGDLFMLNSDGLTSMVPEARVKPIIEGAATLEQAGRELIAAANEAGGRDNITVILFRLEAVDGGAEAAPPGETIEYETWREEGPSSAGDETEAEYRRGGTVAMSAIKPRAEPIDEPPRRTAPLPQTKRRRRRVPRAALGVLAVLAIVLAGLWTASRAIYFVGVDSASGIVTVYRGLPYELPFGIELYERDYASGVRIEQVPAARRPTFTENKLRSRDDAKTLVIELERGRLQ